MKVRRCSRCCQLFRVFRARALFVREMIHPYFKVGLSRQTGGILVLSGRAGSLGISWRILSLEKMSLNRHRASFEPQRALSFMKCVKAPQILGEAVRAERRFLFLCYPLHCWWCWRNLPTDTTIITYLKTLHCADHHPIRIGNVRERLVTASPVMTKSLGPSWLKQ